MSEPKLCSRSSHPPLARASAKRAVCRTGSGVRARNRGVDPAEVSTRKRRARSRGGRQRRGPCPRTPVSPTAGEMTVSRQDAVIRAAGPSGCQLTVAHNPSAPASSAQIGAESMTRTPKKRRAAAVEANSAVARTARPWPASGHDRGCRYHARAVVGGRAVIDHGAGGFECLGRLPLAYFQHLKTIFRDGKRSHAWRDQAQPRQRPVWRGHGKCRCKLLCCRRRT